MAELVQFRSQLGGFNRDDVAGYLERSARQHKKELAALTEACERLETQVAALTAERDALAKALAADEPDAPQTPSADEPSPEQREIEAYRRAEAAERAANLRLQRQAERLNALQAELSERCTGANTEMETLAQALRNGAQAVCELARQMQDDFAASAQAVAALRTDAEA